MIKADVNWRGPSENRQWQVRIENTANGNSEYVDVPSKNDAELLAHAVNNNIEGLKRAMHVVGYEREYAIPISVA